MNKQQQKNLAIIVAIIITFVIHTVSRNLWRGYNSQGIEDMNFIIDLIWSLDIIVVWSFIGFTTNSFKQGLLAGFLHYVLQLISAYFEIPTYILNPLLSFGFFAYLVKFNQSQIIKLSIVGTIVYLGSFTLRNEFVFWDFIREFIRFDIDTINFLNNEVGNTGVLVLSYLVFFILIQICFNRIKDKNGLKLLELNLDLVPSTSTATLYFYLFYIALISYSYNIVSSLVHFMEFEGKSSFFIVTSGLMLLAKLFFIYLLIWFYRKVVVEFLLKKNRTISWNYYFLHTPIIRTIIWLVTCFTQKSETIKPNKSYQVSTTQNDGILAFMIVLFLLSSISKISSGHTNYGLISVLISLASLLLFILYKYGVYIIAAVQLAFFFLLIYLEGNGTITIPSGPMNHWFIILLAFYFIQYPLFHLKEFKIIKSVQPQDIEFFEEDILE